MDKDQLATQTRRSKDLRKYQLILVEDGGGGVVVYLRGKRLGRYMPKPDAVRALRMFGIKAKEINLCPMDIEQERATREALNQLTREAR